MEQIKQNMKSKQEMEEVVVPNADETNTMISTGQREEAEADNQVTGTDEHLVHVQDDDELTGGEPPVDGQQQPADCVTDDGQAGDRPPGREPPVDEHSL